MVPRYFRQVKEMIPKAMYKRVKVTLPVFVLSILVVCLLTTDWITSMDTRTRVYTGYTASVTPLLGPRNQTNTESTINNASIWNRTLNGVATVTGKYEVSAKLVAPDYTLNSTVYGNSSKVTHVGFLKVHKAASTTMQNMLFRFGIKHNLNIAIPKRGNVLYTTQGALERINTTHHDIFACHTVYKKEFYDRLLPSDSVKIGIVREPLDRMLSAAFYHRDVWGAPYLVRVPRNNYIQNLVNYPEKYELNFFSRTRNSMAMDFGFPKATPNDTRLQTYFDTLNKEFALVLVTEKFDESLVLMKRLLKWSISDIIYLISNTHVHTQTILNSTEIEKFKSTSFLDYAIYDHFTKEFDRKVQEAGDSLVEEVKYFQEVLKKVKRFCDYQEAYKFALLVDRSNWNEAFIVTSSDCALMKTKELVFISKIRQRYMLENKHRVSRTII